MKIRNLRKNWPWRFASVSRSAPVSPTLLPGINLFEVKIRELIERLLCGKVEDNHSTSRLSPLWYKHREEDQRVFARNSMQKVDYVHLAIQQVGL